LVLLFSIYLANAFFIRDLCCSFTPFLLLFLNWFSWLSKIIIFPVLIILPQINGKVGDFLQGLLECSVQARRGAFSSNYCTFGATPFKLEW